MAQLNTTTITGNATVTGSLTVGTTNVITTLNSKVDSSNVIDSLDDVIANTKAKMPAGALALRELNSNLNNGFAQIMYNESPNTLCSGVNIRLNNGTATLGILPFIISVSNAIIVLNVRGNKATTTLSTDPVKYNKLIDPDEIVRSIQAVIENNTRVRIKINLAQNINFPICSAISLRKDQNVRSIDFIEA